MDSAEIKRERKINFVILGASVLVSLMIGMLLTAFLVFPAYSVQEINALYFEAFVAEQDIEYDQAIEKYAEILEIDPSNHDALLGKGDAELFLNQIDDAEKTYLHTIELFPKSTLAHLGYFNVLVVKEEYDDALERLNIIEDIDEQNYISESRIPKVQRLMDIQEQLLVDPSNFNLYIEKANIFYGWNLYHSSSVFYNQALSIDKTNINALVGNCNVENALGKTDSARDYAELANDLNSEHPNPLICFARTFITDKEYDIALYYYTLVLKDNPSDTRALLGTGDIYNIAGDSMKGNAYYQRSVDAYSQVINEEPDNTVALVGRGSAHYRLGNYDLALSDYNHVLQNIDSINVPAMLGKGYTLIQMKEYGDAYRLFSQALEIEPRNESIKSAIDTAKRFTRGI